MAGEVVAMRVRPVALTLCLAAFSLSTETRTAAQGCQDQLHQAAVLRAKTAVSADQLRIPVKAWEHLEKARVAATAGRLDLFERETALSLAAAPRFTEVYVLRAMVQVHAHQFETAIDTIAAARRIHAEVAWSGVVLASAFTGLHRYREAVAEMDQLKGVEAASWQWMFERTRAELGLGHLDSALRWSELTLAAAPAVCTDTHLLRGNVLQGAGRHQEAIAQFETYLALTLDAPGTRRTQVQQAIETTRAGLRDQGEQLVASN